MPAMIGIMSQGQMGAGIGARLVAQGHDVLTVTEGRSDASRQRARKAGMRAASWPELAQVDLMISVTPPSEALAMSQLFAKIIAQAGTAPLYADLNAISPKTAAGVAEIVGRAGPRFADGGIFGEPPKPSGSGPAIYVSGDGAVAVGDILGTCLDIRVMDAPAGAASALKICQSGMTKGYTALAAMTVLAATRAGAGGALREVMQDLRPELLTFLGPATSRMFGKAYRYVGEMEQVAAFLADDPAGGEAFGAFREIFVRLADDDCGAQIADLCRFHGIERPEEP